MSIKPSDQEEFNEQVSGFYRREPSQAEAKRKLADHSNSLLKSLPEMLEILPDYPVYAAMAFHGKFEWVDRRSIANLAAENAVAARALQEIRAKKSLRLAASAKPGWDRLLQDSPEALWTAIQMNLAGWKAPASLESNGDESNDGYDGQDHDSSSNDNTEDDDNESEY